MDGLLFMLALDNYSIHTKKFGKHQLIQIFIYGSGSVKLDENTVHTYDFIEIMQFIMYM